MIVRSLAEVMGTDRDVAGDGWRSRRLMLARDGLGFSLHDTTVQAGTELELQYRHHLEACYCLEGEAEITDLANGERHTIGPGVAYALDQHDHHRLVVRRDLRLVCVFNPALAGTERHVDGGYEPSPD
ncbi:MAG TPA: ectoine synthase [Candidatus Limnocylindria bacterium]|nr:ectoine synthase [Candidatus Limnocylindria bacterium]